MAKGTIGQGAVGDRGVLYCPRTTIENGELGLGVHLGGLMR